VEEIAGLRERIVNLEQERDSEKASYEQQLEQLRTEYKNNKDQLIADNKAKGERLVQLNGRFRVEFGLLLDTVVQNGSVIYRVGQLKWGQLTFLMVTFECIGKIQ